MSSPHAPETEEFPLRPWPWLIRVPVGLFVGFVATFCFAVSFIPIIENDPYGPIMGRFGGIVLSIVSLWVFSLALRLVFNRPNHGGLLPPWFLQLFAIYLVAMPIFIVVTGRAASWSIWQYAQAALAVLSGIGYWGLAAWRKASHFRA